MLQSFHITLIGQKHLELRKPCQDFSLIQKTTFNEMEYLIAGISDGVGSCQYSQEGSETSVRAALRSIRDSLTNSASDNIINMLKKAFIEAEESVIEHAIKSTRSPSQYDCTLTLAVYDGSTLWYGHAGDGGIVALDNSGIFNMITKRNKGLFDNQVFPLSDEKSWEFGKAENISGIAMMTDGVLDYVVEPESRGNIIYTPFLECGFTVADSTEKMEEKKQIYEDYFNAEQFRAIVDDDITFCILQNSDYLKNVDLNCNPEKWINELQEYISLEDENLYRASSVISSDNPELEEGNASKASLMLKSLQSLFKQHTGISC